MTDETTKPKNFGIKPRPVNPGPQPPTPRRFKPPRVYKDRIMRIAEENDAEKLNKIRDGVRDLMEKFMEGTATAVMNKEGLPTKRTRKKRGGKMSTGGEVDIDMTTETDV